MKRLKVFLEKWIKFEVYETETEGIYQIYAGISKNENEVDLSLHGFNLFFGTNNNLTQNYHDYGFKTADSFKKAAIYSLYYTSVISAREIVGDCIVDTFRNGRLLHETDPAKYIWEAKAMDNPEKWSIYMDLRNLE